MACFSGGVWANQEGSNQSEKTQTTCQTVMDPSAVESSAPDQNSQKKKPKRKNMRWSDALIIQGIQELDRHPEIDLSGQKARKGDPRADKILSDLFYRQVTLVKLYSATKHYFGSWYVAMEAAGVDVSKYRERFSWDRDKIIEALRVVKAAGIGLAPIGFVENYPDIKSVLSEHFNFEIHPHSIYGAAVDNYFDNWSDAIKAAGFNPDEEFELRLNWWTKDRVIEAMKVLKSERIRLSAHDLNTNSSAALVVLTNHFRVLVKPRSLYQQAIRRHFKTWDEAIIAAGFDPMEEYKIIPGRMVKLPTEEDYQVETYFDENGRRRQIVHVGSPVQSPEEELLKEDSNGAIERVLQKLDEEMQIGARFLLEVIEDENVDVSSFEEVSEKLSELSGAEVSSEEVQNLFAQLAESETLQELLSDN